MNKERTFIGEGLEHTVYEARLSSPTVLKVPKLPTTIGANLRGGTASIREEVALAHDRVKGTEVIIPKTRVFSHGKGYIMAQERIDDDGSISIDSFLEQHGTEHLIKKYTTTPENFAAYEGNVYWLDFTVGRIDRILLATRMINEKQINSLKVIRDKIKQFVRK